MRFHDGLDAIGDARDLLACSTRELHRLGDERIELLACETESGVRRETVEQVVVMRALAHRQRDRHRMLLDDLVRGFAAHSRAHRGHQHLGRGEEGQIALQLAVDDRGEGTELIEDRQEGLEETVDGEEGVGEGDAAYDGAGDIAFVPLVARELTHHARVAAQDHGEAVDALA